MVVQLQPSRIAYHLWVFCIVALALAVTQSAVPYSVGCPLLFLIYAVASVAWHQLRLQHARALIQLTQQDEVTWCWRERSGEVFTVEWLPGSVVLRSVMVLQGAEACGARHYAVIFSDSVSSNEWRRLLVALRLRVR